MGQITMAFSSTFAAICGAVTAAATVTKQTVDTAAAGVSMLDLYVQDAKTQQVASSKLEMSSYLNDLINQANTREAEKEQILAKRFAGDDDFHQRWLKIDARNRALFAPPATP
jgi:hypothetical protein